MFVDCQVTEWEVERWQHTLPACPLESWVSHGMVHETQTNKVFLVEWMLVLWAGDSTSARLAVQDVAARLMEAAEKNAWLPSSFVREFHTASRNFLSPRPSTLCWQNRGLGTASSCSSCLQAWLEHRGNQNRMFNTLRANVQDARSQETQDYKGHILRMCKAGGLVQSARKSVHLQTQPAGLKSQFEELTAADFSTGAIVANNNIRIQMFPIDVRSHVRSLKLLVTVRLAKSSYWLWFIDLQLLIVLSLSSTHLAASAGILVAMPTKNLEMQAGISGTRWCCGNCQKEVKKLILAACRF